MNALRPVLAVPLVGAALLLAGCAEEGSAEQAASPAPAASSPAPAFSLEADPAVPTPLRATTTLQGTVSSGVESGCTVLTAAGGPYLLIGEVPDAALGKAVTVTGRAETGAVTTCMQGTPFLVQSLTVG